jgi:uncharacterized protein (DUF486 family)
MPPIAQTILLLRGASLLAAVGVSWGLALFEYLLQVPAQQKILQEVITLSVFVPFAVLYMKQAVSLNFLWAGLCLMGAVYFTFRG